MMVLRVATVQLPAVQYGLETIKKYLEKADGREVDIICFPEAYLNGYTRNQTVAKERALSLESDAFKKILKDLSCFRATAIIGAIELDADKLFNTAIVVKSGDLVGKYRKAHPQEGIFETGTEYPVFEIKGRKFGINICYDANFPAAAQKLVDQGAEIIFYPLNNELRKEIAERWRYKHVNNLTERARMLRVVTVSSDVIAESDTMIAYGCTAIVNKNGEIVAKQNEFKEGLLVIDLP